MTYDDYGPEEDSLPSSKPTEERVFVLKDGNNYFREWTGIGPACTQSILEAAQFDTREEAMCSPAFAFSLTSFEPQEITITHRRKAV